MLLTITNVVYVLVAVAMVVLILLQRGAGAAAGSGFGGGASATVFGARGSANFLSKSTAVLATLFFAISLGMAVYANRSQMATPSADDLGVMGELAAPSEVPSAEAVPAPATSDLPAPEPGVALPAAAPTEAEAAADSDAAQVDEGEQAPVETETPPRGE